MAAQITVVGICGSLRPASYTRQVVELALEGAREVGALARVLDLAAYDLPFHGGRLDENALPEGLQRMRADVRSAQGIVLGTPEYHGGYSGVLKHALDLMGFAEFEGKMVGLVGVSSGRQGAFDALNGLRTIGRSLHAWVVPEQASIPEVTRAFDEHGRLLREDLDQRVRDVGRQVARFAYLHSSEQVREFLRLWEEAPPNPGASSQ